MIKRLNYPTWKYSFLSPPSPQSFIPRFILKRDVLFPATMYSCQRDSRKISNNGELSTLGHPKILTMTIKLPMHSFLHSLAKSGGWRPSTEFQPSFRFLRSTETLLHEDNQWLDLNDKSRKSNIPMPYQTKRHSSSPMTARKIHPSLIAHHQTHQDSACVHEHQNPK